MRNIQTICIRSVSALAVPVFLGTAITPFLIHGTIHDPLSAAALQAVFQILLIGFLIPIPLVYDVFRHTRVRYYVFTVAACTAALSLTAVTDDPHITAAALLYTAAAVLFSTVWIRFIRIFYGIIGTLLSAAMLLVIYAYTYGHYGVNPLNPTYWHWSEVLPVLAVLWLLIRSWHLSTYTPDTRE